MSNEIYNMIPPGGLLGEHASLLRSTKWARNQTCLLKTRRTGSVLLIRHLSQTSLWFGSISFVFLLLYFPFCILLLLCKYNFDVNSGKTLLFRFPCSQVESANESITNDNYSALPEEVDFRRVRNLETRVLSNSRQLVYMERRGAEKQPAAKCWPTPFWFPIRRGQTQWRVCLFCPATHSSIPPWVKMLACFRFLPLVLWWSLHRNRYHSWSFLHGRSP